MASVIREEIMERNVPIVIIDPHGEYSTLKMPNPDMVFRSDSESPRDIDELDLLDEDDDTEDNEDNE